MLKEYLTLKKKFRENPEMTLFRELQKFHSELSKLEALFTKRTERIEKEVKQVEAEKGERGEKGEKPIAGIDFPFPKDGKRGERGEHGERGFSGYTPAKEKDYFDGKDGRNPLFVGKTSPPNPQKGDLWYKED